MGIFEDDLQRAGRRYRQLLGHTREAREAPCPYCGAPLDNEAVDDEPVQCLLCGYFYDPTSPLAGGQLEGLIELESLEEAERFSENDQEETDEEATG